MLRCLGLFCCLLLAACPKKEDAKLDFHRGWEFSSASDSIWYTAQVPGAVQLDLQRHGLLQDPLVNDNELQAHWVEDTDWIYRRRFKKSEIPKGDTLRIQFNGLDTYCKVSLNGQELGFSQTPFVPFNLELSYDQLQNDNELRLLFYGTHKYVMNNKADLSLGKTAGNDSRETKISPYLRKPAYHMGWDWGPRVVSIGITDSIKILNPSYSNEGYKNRAPSRMRKLELVQKKDSIGTSFEFQSNGDRVFIKGGNYIPLSMYRSEAKDSDYRRMLKAAKESGFNMLRVWGGGTYEKDIFYELCDSLGIYVWQDYMFAGSMYPSDDNYLDIVKQEVAFQSKRLSKYDCIALWCGNNEVDVAWQNWGWQTLLDKDSLECQEEYDLLFKNIIPNVLSNQVLGSSSYIHTSPMSNWGNLENFNHHNMHYWGVWHGPDNFDGFEKYVPRFMSEYGFQSFPMPHTFKGQVDEEQWNWRSKQLRHRQKSYKGTEELIRHLEQHYPLSDDFTGFCYLSQLNQALAMEKAINAHRSSDGHCSGTLYWQLNDVWAAPSWSSIDVKGNWKVAHYKVADLYKETIVVVKQDTNGVELRYVHDGLQERQLTLSVTHADFFGARHSEEEVDFVAKANQDGLIKFITPNREFESTDLLQIKLMEDSKTIDETYAYFGEPKDLPLQALKKEDLQIESLPKNKYRLKAKIFVKDLFFYFEDADNQRFSKNAIDLFPGQEVEITYLGDPSNSELKWLCLNQFVN